MSTDDLGPVREVWEQAAREDPYFAVLSDPDLRGARWDSEHFFATGEAEVALVFSYLAREGIETSPSGAALDFGCGLGRLTQPLAQRFESAVGVDVSKEMLTKARALYDGDAIEFVLNETSDLRQFENERFAFIYSNIVLQHLPPALAKTYVEEFVRITQPSGVIVFQIPDSFRWGLMGRLRRRVRLRTRLAALRGRRPSPDAVEWEMHGTPESTVRAWVESTGEAVRAVAITNATEPTFNGGLLYLADAPAHGWVSKQYCVVKRPTRGPS